MCVTKYSFVCSLEPAIYCHLLGENFMIVTNTLYPHREESASSQSGVDQRSHDCSDGNKKHGEVLIYQSYNC